MYKVGRSDRMRFRTKTQILKPRLRTNGLLQNIFYKLILHTFMFNNLFASQSNFEGVCDPYNSIECQEVNNWKICQEKNFECPAINEEGKILRQLKYT